MVMWEKPEEGFVKINIDGSALSNPRRNGVGTIIRDHQGNFIHAIATPLGEGTNNKAETEAAIIGVQWCFDNGYAEVQLKVDLAILVNWINNSSEPPWSL